MESPRDKFVGNPPDEYHPFLKISIVEVFHIGLKQSDKMAGFHAVPVNDLAKDHLVPHLFSRLHVPVLPDEMFSFYSRQRACANSCGSLFCVFLVEGAGDHCDHRTAVSGSSLISNFCSQN